MSFYQIFLRRCYTKLSVKISLFHAFSVPDMQLRRFLQKTIAFVRAPCFFDGLLRAVFQRSRVFSVCFGAWLQGVVTNRWGRAACFLTIPGWCCRFWIEGLNIGNVPHVFLRMYAVCPVHYAEDRRLGCVCVFGMLTCVHGRCVIVRCAKAFAYLVNSGF